MNDISLNRICSDCKNEIIIHKDNIDEVVLYDGVYYHKDCFIHMCNEKLQSKRCKKIKWQSALDSLNMLCADARLNLNKNFEIEERKQRELSERLKRKEELARKREYEQNVKLEKKQEIEHKRKIAASKSSIEQKEAKRKIFNFILEHYDITCLPKHMFIKLNSIYSGTFKGMSNGILPTELLDMWDRKLSYLNKIANSNITKGKIMSPIQRINYDLSILVNKYDGYKKWKRQQEILEQEQSEQNIEKQIVMIGNIQNEKIEKNTDDISDLVDDIFS